MKIIKQELALTERSYDIFLEHNGEDYLFIVKTSSRPGKQETIISVTRGTCYWDCDIPLEKGEEKELKYFIRTSFNHRLGRFLR